MRLRAVLLAVVLAAFLVSGMSAVGRAADESASDKGAVEKAADHLMDELGLKPRQEGVLLLTNAYYGQLKGNGAEAARDWLSEVTGCTTGQRNLLDVHTAFNRPLWFALFDKKTNKLAFAKWRKDGFKYQYIDASPEKLLNKQAWREASEGLIGKKTLFQIVSISLAWSEDVSREILKAASFHDHLCPGVNIGYLVHVWLTRNMPLAKGEKYLFFGALPKCYMDTLQVVCNATLGKQMAYGVTMNKDQLSRYGADGALPSIIALKVNKKANTCEGVVFGFSWKKVMDDVGVDLADFSPEGGPSNPIFFVSRVKACHQMAKMDLEDKMKWLVTMKRFSGDVALAKRICNAGGDPYKLVWEQPKKVAQDVKERQK